MPPIPAGLAGGAAGGAAAGGAAGGAGAAAGGAAGGLGSAGGSFEGGFGKGVGFNPSTMANQLQRNQGADRHAQGSSASSRDQMMEGNSNLSDERVEDNGSHSVLDSSQAESITKKEAPPEEEGASKGGGIMANPEDEILRSQQKARQQKATQEQFMPSQQRQKAGGSPQGQSSTTQKTSSSSEGESEDEEEEGEEEDAQQQAQQLQQQQRQSAMASAKQRVKDEAIERLKAKIRQRLVKRAANAGTRATIEGTEVATAETVVPIIVLIAELNIQLINKYFFTPLFFKGWNEEADEAIEGSAFFDQSFIEDMITIWIDIQMTCGSICFNPMCWPAACMIIFITIIGGGVREIAGKIGVGS
jgi:hypothetical protein